MQDVRTPQAPTEIRADTFRAAIVERRIAVDFGRVQPNSPVQDDISIALTGRIEMDPATVVRLISALREALAQHAARWPSSGEAPGPASRAPTRSHAEPDEGGERAAHLIRLVDALGSPYYHERSFRVSEQSLAANRFLLTLNTKSIRGDLRTAVGGICRQISMPADWLDQVEDALSGAKAVHFGFEGDQHIVHKVYLESKDALAAAANAPPGKPVLLHVAFKWDSKAPDRRAISRYFWFPGLSVAGIAERIAGIYQANPSSPSIGISRGVLDLAAGSMNPEDLQYLEVREDGNSRLSYDLNVYNAGLQLKDVQPQLAQMRDRFGIGPGQFQALYDQVKGRVFGHLAGGIHRNGREFFNVYYGVQRHKG